MQKHFIGYGLLEDWADQADLAKSVLADAVSSPGPTSKQGLRQDKLSVYVAQIDPDGNVHYCSLACGYLSYVAGRPFDTDHEQRKQRQEQVYQLILDWLKEHGFYVRRAVVATPTNLRFLDGWANFIQYNKDTKTFYRSDSPVAREVSA